VLTQLLPSSFVTAQIFHISAPIPHIVLGTALGLLLVFRTTAAYDRFWEGRKLWATIVSHSRLFSANALSGFGASNPHAAEQLVAVAAAFPATTMKHLRGLPANLGDGDVAVAMALGAGFEGAGNQPCVLLGFMAAETERLCMEAARESYMRDEAEGVPGRSNAVCELSRAIMVAGQMKSSVLALMEALGSCERIVDSPVPTSYSRHTSRFVTMFCFSLPLVMVELVGPWWSVLFMALISWSLYSIEEIAHTSENPFTVGKGSIPLERICDMIAADLKETIAHRSVLRHPTSPPRAPWEA